MRSWTRSICLEEMGYSDKVLFIHPKQVTQLRKTPDFLSADKYTPGVGLTGGSA